MLAILIPTQPAHSPSPTLHVKQERAHAFHEVPRFPHSTPGWTVREAQQHSRPAGAGPISTFRCHDPPPPRSASAAHEASRGLARRPHAFHVELRVASYGHGIPLRIRERGTGRGLLTTEVDRETEQDGSLFSENPRSCDPPLADPSTASSSTCSRSTASAMRTTTPTRSTIAGANPSTWALFCESQTTIPSVPRETRFCSSRPWRPAPTETAQTTRRRPPTPRSDRRARGRVMDIHRGTSHVSRATRRKPAARHALARRKRPGRREIVSHRTCHDPTHACPQVRTPQRPPRSPHTFQRSERGHGCRPDQEWQPSTQRQS